MKLRIAACFYKKSQRKSTLARFDSNKHITDKPNNFVDSLTEKLINPTNVNFELLENSIADAASSTLPNLTRPCPDWFSQNEKELSTLIQRRNTTIFNRIRRTPRSTTYAAKCARNELKVAINCAKSTWITKLCTDINSGPNPINRGTKSF